MSLALSSIGDVNRPLVIGHRGASGHRPELSAGALRLAFRLGADAVEIDVVPSRDGQLAVRHDFELSRTTDVARRPEFTQLRRTVEIDGEVTNGWFTHDFTMAELRTLRCRERWSTKRAASATFDDRWPVLSLDEAIEVVAAESARQGRTLTMYVEIKDPEFAESVGHCLPSMLSTAYGNGSRALPSGVRIVWLSFDRTVLRRMALRGFSNLVQLFDARPKGRDISEVASHVQGISVRCKHLLPRDSSGAVHWPDGPAPIAAKAARHGLDVYAWTHRAENKHLPTNLRVGHDHHGHGQSRREAMMLFAAGCDGLITDFPEIGVAALAGRQVAAAG